MQARNRAQRQQTRQSVPWFPRLYERYRVPVFISETASLGSIKRRADWLRDSVQSARRAREAGIPLLGYTWWPLFALVTWAYRQGMKPPTYYIKQMGLWDLKADDQGNLHRTRTGLVDMYKELVSTGAMSVGSVGAIEGQVLQERT